jgi:hypothetical protein
MLPDHVIPLLQFALGFQLLAVVLLTQNGLHHLSREQFDLQ